jgi:hypothetical protein
MTDLSDTIAPKSDQMNADDLIGGPRTITVSGVKRMDAPDQPIAIHFEGDDNKPFKPCKSMRRVLVMVWGNDGNGYTGRSMTLYRDPGVQFGGQQVGGIRISHMSHIDKPVTMALTATRANRRPFTVKPLAATMAAPAPTTSAGDAEARRSAAEQKITDGVRDLIDRVGGCPNEDAVHEIIRAPDATKRRDWLRTNRPDLSARLESVIGDALKRLSESTVTADDNDGWPGPDASQVAA